MSSSSAADAYGSATTRYQPRHAAWPYSAADFSRADPSPDTAFYDTPRLVTHIDDAAIASLRRYYAAVLPAAGTLLDFCSSWVSHLPERHLAAARAGTLRVLGQGMSEAELDVNGALAHRAVLDLNARPDALGDAAIIGLRAPGLAGDEAGAGAGAKLDAATCVVSIDYLTSPVAVLAALRRNVRQGGAVHLVVSNRCFPTKAIARWLRVGEQERLQMVGDFLWFAGWRDVEIVDLKKDEQDGGAGSGLAAVMRMFGGTDPLWCVRGVNRGDGEGAGEGVE